MARRYSLHSFFDDKTIEYRRCDRSGCQEKGEYRAPVSPSKLHNYYWFCLEHVREYNLNWDYYKQMSQQDIERLYSEDVTWQRPSWKFGFSKSTYHKFTGFFREDFFKDGYHDIHEKQYIKTIIDSEQTHALTLLGLDHTANMTAIKARYKQLAKQYHPDINNNNPHHEEKLKEINQAYQVLKRKFMIA